ncbi:MAG: NAD-dependent epimerase/dehydratase family protein, partial [Trebonia sp.]
MRVLILGGTRFLGRAITDAALGRGDTVTLFNRGVSNPGLYPGVETITGDRASDLSGLDGRAWDAVIDVAGYDPRVVRRSAEALAGRTGRYVFVSTVSVYADQNTTAAQLEDAPVARLRPGATSLEETYGPNKALCEQAVRDVYGDRALIGRPGLITGPHDPTDRVPYWPRRIARGGRVLAPGDPAGLVQFIDVRDLAAFLADACHAGTAGVFQPDWNPGPVRDIYRSLQDGGLQRRRAGLDPHRAAGRGGRRPGNGHSAVGRRAGLRRVQRRRQLPRGRRRPGVPARDRHDPRHPVL